MRVNAAITFGLDSQEVETIRGFRPTLLKLIWLAISLILFLALTTSASTFHTGDRIRITNLHQIDGDLYVFGENATIDGTVDGDFICGAYQINSNGKITGSANLAAYSISHSGTVDGSLRATANILRISGRVGRSVVAAAGNITLENGAEIKKDVSIVAGRATIDGKIGGNLDFEGGKVFISGDIDGNVKLVGDRITIAAPATIKGNLTYKIRNKKDFDLQEGVVVNGEITHKEFDGKNEAKSSGVLRDFILSISFMLAAFLFGVILISMFRKYGEASVTQMRSRFGMCLAVGILTSLIVAAAIFVLAASIIFSGVGLALVVGEAPPVGAIMLIFSILLIPITSFTSVTGAILFYSGKIIVALILGSLIVTRFKADARPLGKVQLLLGLSVLAAAYAIPYIGLLISLVVSLAGAGAIVFGVKKCPFHSKDGEADISPPPQSSVTPPIIPPPTATET